MADEATPTSASENAEETQQAATEQAASTDDKKVQTYTQEQVNAMLADHKKRIQGQFADYDDLKKAVAEGEEASKTSQSQLEEVTSERDSLKGQLSAAELEATKLRVAFEKNVPLALIDRINGSSKEELEGDADALLAALKPAGGGFDGGVRPSTPAADIAAETDPAKVLEWAQSLRK